MNQGDIILLSSDEDESDHPQKKIKLDKDTSKTIETHHDTNGCSSSDDSTSNIASELDGASDAKSSENGKKENQAPNVLFDHFMDACHSSLKNSVYEAKVLPVFPKIRQKFNECKSIQGEPFFKGMLEEFTASAQTSAADAVIVFQRLYSYLIDNTAGVGVEVPEEIVSKLMKLEKCIRKLTKKIKSLEEAEVDFDLEQNSQYMQLDRYVAHLVKVHEKYCQLLKRNPHAGRLLYEKILFVNSQYDAVNRAITKAYKSNHFPTYYDIEKCVRKCVTENKLGLTDTQIKEESKHCFTKLGNLLQIRRKKELYEVHRAYVENSIDPASKDPDLTKALDESRNDGEKRMAEVVSKYVRLQEDNAPIVLSEDSDDSHFKESDTDD